MCLSAVCFTLLWWTVSSLYWIFFFFFCRGLCSACSLSGFSEAPVLAGFSRTRFDHRCRAVLWLTWANQCAQYPYPALWPLCTPISHHSVTPATYQSLTFSPHLHCTSAVSYFCSLCPTASWPVNQTETFPLNPAGQIVRPHIVLSCSIVSWCPSGSADSKQPSPSRVSLGFLTVMPTAAVLFRCTAPLTL